MKGSRRAKLTTKSGSVTKAPKVSKYSSKSMLTSMNSFMTTPTNSYASYSSQSTFSRSLVANTSIPQTKISSPSRFSPNRSVFAPSMMLLANPKQKKQAKKKGGMEEEEEDAFAGAGDVKKRIKNWMEKILTTKPQPLPLPQAAQEDEAQFVKECQARFAARLDRRSRHEMAKITVKQRAIEALPAALKTEALKEDNALWSMQIISPTTFPPRKRWLMEHYQIPYTPSTEELESEEAQKKRYARFV